MSEDTRKFACPCCGYRTLDLPSPGSFEVCPICYWEDDNVQFEDPDYQGGANHISLREAQRNFLDFGAASKDAVACVRKPESTDERDPAWKPVS